MDDKPIQFDRKDWNKRLSDLIQEHPEIGTLTGKMAVYSNKGVVQKVKIEDKVI